MVVVVMVVVVGGQRGSTHAADRRDLGRLCRRCNSIKCGLPPHDQHGMLDEQPD